MKVIFVGLHNKPGMKPLDSRTKSGKLVDRTIRFCPIGPEYVKSNLFDWEFIPDKSEWDRWNNDWFNRIDPGKDDIIILLGALTQRAFHAQGNYQMIKKIRIGHPASMWSLESQRNFVATINGKVREIINCR